MIGAKLARSRESRRPIALVLFDIDRFKRVNDRFGHVAGDQVPGGAVKFGDVVEFLAQDVVARHLLTVDKAFFPLFAPDRR